MQTAGSIGTSRKKMRIAGAVMERALHGEGRVDVARAARQYAAAIAAWRRAIVAAAPSERIETRRVA